MTRLPPAWPIVLSAIVLGLSQGLGEIVRDCSLTCNVGFRHAPLAFLAVAVLGVPFVSMQIRLLGRVDFLRWQIGSTLVAASSFLLFRGITYLAVAGESAASASSLESWHWIVRLSYIAYYIWLDLIFTLLNANLFVLVNRIFGSRAEQGLGLTAACLLVGGLAGAWLAGVLGPWLSARLLTRFEIARDHLMIFMGLVLLLNVPVLKGLGRRAAAIPLPPRPSADPAAPTPGLGQAWAVIRADRTTAWLAGVFVMTGLAAIFLDYLFYWLVTEQAEGGSDGLVSFFAALYVWLNGFSLLFLLFGADWLVRRFGLRFALLALPVALLIGTASLLVYRILLAVCAVRILQEGLWSTLYDPATERLVLRIGASRYDLLRPVLEGVVTRSGVAIASLLILSLSFGPGLGLSTMLKLAVVVQLVWMGTILGLWRSLRRTSEQAAGGAVPP